MLNLFKRPERTKLKQIYGSYFKNYSPTRYVPQYYTEEL